MLLILLTKSSSLPIHLPPLRSSFPLLVFLPSHSSSSSALLPSHFSSSFLPTPLLLLRSSLPTPRSSLPTPLSSPRSSIPSPLPPPRSSLPTRLPLLFSSFPVPFPFLPFILIFCLSLIPSLSYSACASLPRSQYFDLYCPHVQSMVWVVVNMTVTILWFVLSTRSVHGVGGTWRSLYFDLYCRHV